MIRTNTASPGAPIGTGYLLQADWGGPAWERAILGYVAAFGPDEPVALLLPPPAGGADPQRVVQLLGRAPRERIPEIVLLDQPAELLEVARRFAKVIPVAAPSSGEHPWKPLELAARPPPPPLPPGTQLLTPGAVAYMAVTGEGTDACLAAGVLPMLVHFYTPVPDIPDLQKRKVFARRSDLPGVDFREQAQLAYLAELGGAFGEECRWPGPAPSDPHQFHLDNGSFSFGCAAALHTVLRRHRPRRVIEIGSGQSSKVIAAALAANRRDGHAAEYTIVDPFPGDTIRTLPGLTRLVADRVELVQPGTFDALGADDVLFIDSSHTVKTGGDVNALYLDVIPRLAPGVLVHAHDIPLPFEYAEVYFTNPSFRVFWTEAYLLQAFLAFNGQFEVLLSLPLVQSEHREAFAHAFPHWDPVRYPVGSGSFWMRRKPTASGS